MDGSGDQTLSSIWSPLFWNHETVLKKMYGDNSRPGIAHLLKVMESQSDLTENEYEEIVILTGLI